MVMLCGLGSQLRACPLPVVHEVLGAQSSFTPLFTPALQHTPWRPKSILSTGGWKRAEDGPTLELRTEHLGMPFSGKAHAAGAMPVTSGKVVSFYTDLVALPLSPEQIPLIQHLMNT